MATRKRATRAKSEALPSNGKKCMDCENSYDWHSRALDGHLILCRCPYKQKGGKFCIFLTDQACAEHFKPRTKQGDLYGEEHQD